MIIYEDYNFAFLHINKTGGMAVKKLLGGIADESYSTKNPHLTIKLEFKRAWVTYPDIDMYNLNIYTNIRNPFDRIVSMYAYRLRSNRNYKDMPFKDFFYSVYFNGSIVSGPIEEFLLIDGKVPKNLNIVRLEDANDRWPVIIKRHFGIDIGEFPKINTSEHEDPITYFSLRMIKIVMNREKWVIENYYPELLIHNKD